jgi:hypothetical protein
MKPTIQSMRADLRAGKKWVDILRPYCKIRTRKTRSAKKWRKNWPDYIPEDIRKDTVFVVAFEAMDTAPTIKDRK